MRFVPEGEMIGVASRSGGGWGVWFPLGVNAPGPFEPQGDVPKGQVEIAEAGERTVYSRFENY